jgi:hypothetical protein
MHHEALHAALHENFTPLSQGFPELINIMH